MSRGLVAAAQFLALGVVFHVFHQRGIHPTALFHHQALSLVVEDPDLIAREIGIILVEKTAHIQPTELGSALGVVQHIAGAVVKKLVLCGALFEFFPFLIGNLIHIAGIDHGPIFLSLRFPQHITDAVFLQVVRGNSSLLEKPVVK